MDNRCQSKFPWDSSTRPYGQSNDFVWLHELLKSDGSPYRAAEIDLIKRLAIASRHRPTPPRR